jgi:Flp pilus assembly protein TadG
MAFSSLLHRLRGHLAAFRTADRGNVAVIFALASIPMVGFVGAAVDYSRVNSDRTAMQAAADATALMLSKNVASLTSDQIQQEATNYFNALFTRPGVSGVQVTPTYTTTNGTQVVVTASGIVPTTFLGTMGRLMGQDLSSVTIGTSSTVKWGSSRLRVALVLDNTGSMAQSSKMTALKTAAKNLLTQLRSAAGQNGDVYVSIIPFAKDVNADPVNYNQSWVKWDDGTDTSWDGANGTCSKNGGWGSPNSPRSACTALGTCSKSGYSTQSTCTAAGTCSLSSYNSQSSCTGAGTCSLTTYTSQSTCTSGGTCSKSGYTSQSTCTVAGTCSKSTKTTQSSCTTAGGTWTAATWTAGSWTAGSWTAATWTPAVWTPTAHSGNWNGCMMDRDQSYDTTNDAPSTSTPATLFPAEQYDSCPTTLMALSYDWTALSAKIDAMVPNGGTNQAIGLQWGYQSLTAAPFTIPAMDSNYKYQKVIILLTDGLNTQDRWYGDGMNPSSQVDDRQRITCDNVNAAGITLYTVQVNTDGAATSTLLQNCAGTGSDPTQTPNPKVYPDSSKFFLLTSSDAIITTFQQIGTDLSFLRVAK